MNSSTKTAHLKKTLEKQVWDALATVIDPELNMDIVAMGLVYGVKIKLKDKNKPLFAVEIEMTLTTAGCPLVGVIQAMILQAVGEIDPKILPKKNVKLNLVFDPPWTPDMMSQAAKEKLKFIL